MTPNKTSALALGLAALSTAALAQPRPSTTQMSCSQARAFLQSQGAAVIGTGGFTFDRFVVSRTFCEPSETTRAALVPTLDTHACMIGYTCLEPSRDQSNRD
jgi:hypothetical protein